jgi:hypothetical protein
MRTREEHLKWCKDRAIQEYDFYQGADKQRNGLTSMMSDLRKHPETASPTLQALVTMQMLKPMTRQQFVNFIDGFN